MDATPPIEVSVVIPVYGSAGILPSLVERLDAVLVNAATGHEVIFVHDHGPDDAWAVIVELARTRPWLRGLDLRRNTGQHNAVMAGLGQAGGRYVITMDDDLQHDPGDIPRILDRLRIGVDLVYVQFESRQHALWKRLGSWFNDLVARWLLKKPRGLYLSPFRGMTAAMAREVLRYEGPFVYIDGLLLQSTGDIATIEARHHTRSDGRSGYSLRKSISLWLQMATSFSVIPLRLVSVAGILASGMGFVLTIVILLESIWRPAPVAGWQSLMLTVLILGGVQLLALGVIGEYVGRVLLSINRRPQYVVREGINLRRRD